MLLPLIKMHLKIPPPSTILIICKRKRCKTFQIISRKYVLGRRKTNKQTNPNTTHWKKENSPYLNGFSVLVILKAETRKINIDLFHKALWGLPRRKKAQLNPFSLFSEQHDFWLVSRPSCQSCFRWSFTVVSLQSWEGLVSSPLTVQVIAAVT